MAREKFADRYGVETYQAYKGDPARVKIPPAGHPLHDPTAPTTPDPLRCAEIDCYEGWARVIRFLDSGDATLLDEMPDAAADAIRKAMEPRPAGRQAK